MMVSSTCTAPQTLVVIILVTCSQLELMTINALTLQINSKPLAPMSASLYRAPQTYDRGKKLFQRPYNPYILISKMRQLCDWSSQKKSSFDHTHEHRQKIGDGRREPGSGYLKNPILATATSMTTLSPIPPLGLLYNFNGSWKFTKPDTTNENSPSNSLVTYNDDGTRVLSESLYNLQAIRSPPSQNTAEYVHNITFSDVNSQPEVASLSSETTTKPPESTILILDGTTKPPQVSSPPSKPPRHVETSTLQVTITSPKVTISPSAVTFSSLEVPNKRLNVTDEPLKMTLHPEITISPTEVTTKIHHSTLLTTKEQQEQKITTTTTENEFEFDYEESTTQSTTIMDKLGGGAKRLLAHILGGFLHGRQTQKNLEVTDTSTPDQLDLDSAEFSPMSYSSLPFPSTNYGSGPEFSRNYEPHLTTLKPTVGQVITGGWRPILPWPPSWLKEVQNHQRPAAPPATIVHHWLSTIWNDTQSNETESKLFKEVTTTPMTTPICLNVSMNVSSNNNETYDVLVGLNPVAIITESPRMTNSSQLENLTTVDNVIRVLIRLYDQFPLPFRPLNPYNIIVHHDKLKDTLHVM